MSKKLGAAGLALVNALGSAGCAVSVDASARLRTHGAHHSVPATGPAPETYAGLHEYAKGRAVDQARFEIVGVLAGRNGTLSDVCRLEHGDRFGTDARLTEEARALFGHDFSLGRACNTAFGCMTCAAGVPLSAAPEPAWPEEEPGTEPPPLPPPAPRPAPEPASPLPSAPEELERASLDPEAALEKIKAFCTGKAIVMVTREGDKILDYPDLLEWRSLTDLGGTQKNDPGWYKSILSRVPKDKKEEVRRRGRWEMEAGILRKKGAGWNADRTEYDEDEYDALHFILDEKGEVITYY